MSVLPDDVGGLRGVLEVELLSAQLAEVHLVVDLSSVVSFFVLEGHEARAGGLAEVEDLVTLDSRENLLVLLLELLPLLSLDELSSLLEPVDDLTVVEGECDLGNLDLAVWQLLEAKIGDASDSLLKSVLDVQLELCGLRDGVGGIVEVLLPSLVGLRVQVELDGVVTGGDGLDVPVDITGALITLDVVVVDNSEEVHEDTDGGDN